MIQSTSYPRTPNPERIEEAMNQILRSAQQFPGALMDIQRTKITHTPCHTVSCFAGWWQVSQLNPHTIRTRDNQVVDAKGRLCTYEVAASDFAEFLGLKSLAELEDWGLEYPELWGGSYGDEMFCSLSAYFPDDDPIPTENLLEAICNHWRQVADRIRNQEALQTSL